MEQEGFKLEEAVRILFENLVNAGVRNSTEYLAKQYGTALPPEEVENLRRVLRDRHQKTLAEQESKEREKGADA